MKITPRSVIIALVALGITAFVGYVSLVVVFPWSPVCCRHQDIDINSGRVRHTRYVLFCKVSERVENTPLSDAIGERGVASATPDWRRVNTFSPGVHHSPHYGFHSAFGQVGSLTGIWQHVGFGEEVRRKTAADLLALWRLYQGDFVAGYYIQWFWNHMDELKESHEFRGSVGRRLLGFRIGCTPESDGRRTCTAFYPNGLILDQFRELVNDDGEYVRDGESVFWSTETEGERWVYENGRVTGKHPVSRAIVSAGPE